MQAASADLLPVVCLRQYLAQYRLSENQQLLLELCSFVFVQASNSSRRLLSSSSADVTTQLNAGSASAVTAVATDLNRVTTGGDLAVSLLCHALHAVPRFACQVSILWSQCCVIHQHAYERRHLALSLMCNALRAEIVGKVQTW